MADKRKGDSEPYTRFRSGRLFKDGGKWYFCTREGTTEGPFELRAEAEEQLKVYIKILCSGFMPSDSILTIEPLGADTLKMSQKR